jgi:hypothetical protein
MSPAFLAHLQRNWPLTVIIVGLLIYLPIALITGDFYTNQGRIFRSAEPKRYSKWILAFTSLLLACVAVLAGSFVLAMK